MEWSSYGKEIVEQLGIDQPPAVCVSGWFDWWKKDECRDAVIAVAIQEIRKKSNEVHDGIIQLNKKIAQ